MGCYVKGTALETIKGYLVIGDDNSYHAALSLFAERYGNHLVLCNAFRLKLDSWSKNSDFDRAGLRSYADFFNQCLSARNKFHLNILDDEFENDKMLEKLPSWMRGKWARIVCDPRRNIMSFPTFREFVNFVTLDLWIDPMPLTSSRSPSRSTTSSYTHRSSPHVELTPNQSNYSNSPTSKTSRDQNCPSMSIVQNVIAKPLFPWIPAQSLTFLSPLRTLLIQYCVPQTWRTQLHHMKLIS